MRAKFRALLKSTYWRAFFFALLLFLVEDLFQPLPGVYRYFTVIALRSQPLLTFSTAGQSWGRAFFLYWLVALWLESGLMRLRARLSFRRMAVLVLGWPLLFFTAGSSWQTEQAKKNLADYFSKKPAVAAAKPSFVLFSFDSLSAEITGSQTQSESLMPLWEKRWRSKAIVFENAYTVINSTYAAWYSILSGEYPFHSGVKTLFPNQRTGKFGTDELLPRKFKDEGYRTVYLTDCANTAFFGPDSGFQERYQPDPGFFGCEQAIITARHALTRLFSRGQWPNPFFPAIDSDCSKLGRPDQLFNQVQAKLSELDQDPRPFLLVAHSCLTSPETFERDGHLKKVDREGAVVSKNRDEYERSIRHADFYLNQMLIFIGNLKHSAYRLVLADHGVRLQNNQQGEEVLSHASGWPLSRFQYHVPLAIIRPGKHSGKEIQNVVSLLDIYPTLLTLAKIPFTVKDGHDLLLERDAKTSLILTSALPVENSSPVYQNVIRDVSLDPEGAGHFSVVAERQLQAAGLVALLDPPRRFLFNQQAKLTMQFAEWDDPHNRRPLSDPSLEAAESRKLVRFYSPGLRPETWLAGKNSEIGPQP